MIDSQKPGFEELYQAFLGFFMESLQRDGSPWNKIRLQMLSQYFDDLALYKIIHPIIERIQSNPEDRRAIARAALWDSFAAHQMGQLFTGWTQMKPPEPQPVTVTSGFVQGNTTVASGTVPEIQTTAAGTVTEIKIAKTVRKAKGKR